MSTAADLISSRVSTGLADEKLFEVAPRVAKINGHHIVVLHESNGRFIGLIRLTDVIARADSGNRILADLVSAVSPVIVRYHESAGKVAALFEKHQLGEVVVFEEGNRYVGLITAESVLHWSRLQWERAESQVRAGQVETGHGKRLLQPNLEATADFPPSTRISSEAPHLGEVVDQAATSSPLHVGVAFRILLVEDHEPSRSALRDVLIRRKFAIVEAGSLKEARKLAKDDQFDLVISDIGLPDGSGYDLMSSLPEGRGLMGISVTAYGRPSDVAQSKLAGFSHHFTKPIKVEALLDAIQQMVSAKSGKTPRALL